MRQLTDDELRAEADRLLAAGLREILADYGEATPVDFTLLEATRCA